MALAAMRGQWMHSGAQGPWAVRAVGQVASAALSKAARMGSAIGFVFQRADRDGALPVLVRRLGITARKR